MAPKEDNRSGIDKFFDAADSAVNQVVKVVSPASPKQAPDDSDDPDDLSNRWEKSWEEGQWAPVEEFQLPSPKPDITKRPQDVAYRPTRINPTSPILWHAFRSFGKTVCGRDVDMSRIGGLRTLEHSRAIPACTSCIIGVSR